MVVFPYSDKIIDDFNPGFEFGNDESYWFLWIVLIIVILIVSYYLYKKGVLKKPGEEDLGDDLKKMIEIIEKRVGELIS